MLWGNGRCYIDTTDGYEFIILQPDRTASFLMNGKKYHVTKPEGIHDRLMIFQQVNKHDIVVLEDSEVIHIPGFGYNGIEGLSLCEMAGLSWNTGRASDLRANSQMRFGFSGGITLEAPNGAFRSDKEAEDFYKNISARQAGPDNAGKPLLLKNGIKLAAPVMSNKDAEFIQARRFQREEAALWFLLESILGGEKTEGYNTQEQKNLAYLTNCLMTWLVRWTEELNVKLLSKSELKRGFSFHWDTSILLRADYETLITAYCKLIQHTVYSPNDVLMKLGEKKRPGGDVYENPSTSSGKDQSDKLSEDPKKKTAKARLKHLATVEAKRIVQFSETDSFQKKTSSFYAGWRKTLAEAFEDSGVSGELATKWCDESEKDIADLGAIKAVEKIQSRVDQFFEE